MFKKIIPLVVLIAFIVSAYYLGVDDYISLESIKENRAYLTGKVDSHPILSGFIFMALYIMAVALSLPIASLLTLLGGFLFGLVLGTTMIVISATIGASIIFLIAKSTLGDSLRNRAGPFYSKVADNMTDNAIQYMLFTRLVPVIPFFIANIIPALFNIKLRDFVLTTFIGIIPGTAVYTNIGRGLSTIETTKDLVSFDIIVAFTILGLFTLVPVFWKMYQKRKKTSS